MKPALSATILALGGALLLAACSSNSNATKPANNAAATGSAAGAAVGSAAGTPAGSAASATGGRPAAASTPRDQVTLHLGYFPNLTHASAIVGVDSGIFQKDLGANVKLQTSTFNAGGPAVTALLSGGLDASYMGPSPAVNGYVQSGGQALRVISGATSGGASLVVQANITSAADLKGKKIASPQLGNTQDVSLRTWLQKQGLKTDAQGGGDVAVVPEDNGVTLNAFKSGQIAGAWVPEPWATQLVQDDGGKVLVDERSIWPNGQFVTTLLVVRTAYMQQHPDVVAALIRGQIDANTYLNTQPAQAQKLVADGIARITSERIPAQTVAAAWNKLTFTNDPIASSLQTGANEAVSLGFLKLNGVDLTKIYDLGPLNTALKAANATPVASQ